MNNKTKKTTFNIAILELTMIAMAFVSCGGADKNVTAALPNATAQSSNETATVETEANSETEWLAIFVNDHKSGHIKSTRTQYAERIVTEVTTSMEMRRGADTVPIVAISKMTETLDGKPLEIEKTISGQGMNQKTAGIIDDQQKLNLTIESAGRTTRRIADWPQGSLMAEGQRLEALRYGLKEGTNYKSVYFDPDLLEPIEVEITVGGKEQLDLLGRSVAGIKVALKMKVRGIQSDMVMYVNDNMNTLFTRSDKMGMKVEMIACTKHYALSVNDPAEIIRGSFTEAPTPVSKKMKSGTLVYEIELFNEGRNLEIISTDEQQTKRKGDVITVTVSELSSHKQKARSLGVIPYRGNNNEALEALKPNHWVQNDAEEIIKLAKAAVEKETNPFAAALKIERFVESYISKKDLSVGYASALETARSRQGDCTEHTLLTAALCRAVGIPARIVFGLLYVEQYEDLKNVFGGHAWTTVFIEGKWLSLDAAAGGFDTGRIALAVSDGDPADFFQIIDMIGNLEIISIKQQ